MPFVFLRLWHQDYWLNKLHNIGRIFQKHLNAMHKVHAILKESVLIMDVYSHPRPKEIIGKFEILGLIKGLLRYCINLLSQILEALSIECKI